MKKTILGTAILTACTFAVACTPTVKVAAPEKPITINLNVKIDHELKVKVAKDVDKALEKKGLF